MTCSPTFFVLWPHGQVLWLIQLPNGHTRASRRGTKPRTPPQTAPRSSRPHALALLPRREARVKHGKRDLDVKFDVDKCPPPHFCRRISKVFGVSRSRLGVRRAARWFRARSSHAFGSVLCLVSTTTARTEPGCLGGCNSAALGGPSGDRTRNERRAQQSAGPPTPRGAMAR